MHDALAVSRRSLADADLERKASPSVWMWDVGGLHTATERSGAGVDARHRPAARSAGVRGTPSFSSTAIPSSARSRRPHSTVIDERLERATARCSRPARRGRTCTKR